MGRKGKPDIRVKKEWEESGIRLPFGRTALYKDDRRKENDISLQQWTAVIGDDGE